MKAAGIKKEEILTILMEMHGQLGELDTEFQSAVNIHCADWYGKQNQLLADCDKRLDVLEESYFISNSGISDSKSMDLTNRKPVSLELGY
ncbi:hypothetical protein [Mesobacillus zeae]|uniref:Uncharacterized protein n=1 Tax=Mesobacillus zeae TaxID=1917180 RepID=A0A398B339_9BACI|nr:hypothetical protein [Mesobacillus zeae]RID84212.1 hypothetical protein D1970_13950 [Mesobacillus zeae]